LTGLVDDAELLNSALVRIIASNEAFEATPTISTLTSSSWTPPY
jgi:hypothetical protein